MRRTDEPRGRLRPAEEVGLDLGNRATAELEVAHARALVRPLELLAVEARGDVVGHDLRGALREHAGLGHRQRGDVADGVDVRETGRKVSPLYGHPVTVCEPGIEDHLRRAVYGDPDEQVVRKALAIGDARLVLSSVELHDVLIGDVLDAALGQSVEEAPGNLLRDRHRCRHRPGDADLDRIPEAALDEVVVEEKRALERRRRALERMAEDPEQDLPRVDFRENVAHPLRSRDRVVLDAALFEPRRGREVVRRSERDDEDVGVVGARVRHHVPRLRVDRDHALPAELDAHLGDLCVGQEHVRLRLAAEENVELREPEGERVVPLDQRGAPLAGERLGQPRRELQAREPCTEDHDVLHPSTISWPPTYSDRVQRADDENHQDEPGRRREEEEGGEPACLADRLCPECGAVLDGGPHRPGCSHS